MLFRYLSLLLLSCTLYMGIARAEDFSKTHARNELSELSTLVDTMLYKAVNNTPVTPLLNVWRDQNKFRNLKHYLSPEQLAGCIACVGDLDQAFRMKNEALIKNVLMHIKMLITTWREEFFPDTATNTPPAPSMLNGAHQSAHDDDAFADTFFRNMETMSEDEFDAQIRNDNPLSFIFNLIAQNKKQIAIALLGGYAILARSKGWAPFDQASLQSLFPENQTAGAPVNADASAPKPVGTDPVPHMPDTSVAVPAVAGVADQTTTQEDAVRANDQPAAPSSVEPLVTTPALITDVPDHSQAQLRAPESTDDVDTSAVDTDSHAVSNNAIDSSALVDDVPLVPTDVVVTAAGGEQQEEVAEVQDDTRKDKKSWKHYFGTIKHFMNSMDNG